MKKRFFLIFALTLLFSVSARAASLDFEDGAPATVDSTLSAGGEAVFDSGFAGQGLKLDGSYGLKLGAVDGSFTASAMVRVTSGGDNRTLFFKNMGSKENENWTGVIFNGGVPTFWVRDGWSKRPTEAENCMNKWVYIVYTEDNGRGCLYADGRLVASGGVNAEEGELYLGVTYWEADALSGSVDWVEVLDRAMTPQEVRKKMDEWVIPVLFGEYAFPSELLVSDIDLSAVPGGDGIAWASSNEAVLSSQGVLTRPYGDTKVSLFGRYGNITRRFTFTALGKGAGSDGGTVLSYHPADAVDGVLPDLSGNGNHGVVHGSLSGGNFDGADYVDLPKMLFDGLDRCTVVLRFSPWNATSDQLLLSIGNFKGEYFSVSASTPGTNRLRAAMNVGGEEKDIYSTPGFRGGQYGTLVITCDGTYYKMYQDGRPVAAGDLGAGISAPGDAGRSYLGKAPYNAANFRGTVDEFTVLAGVMSDEEIYAAYGKNAEPSDGSWFAGFDTENGLRLRLRRNCMLAVSLYDTAGGFVSAKTQKVSGDDLTFVLNLEGAAAADIAAFDPATGIVGDRIAVSVSGELAAYARDGVIAVANGASADRDAVVMLAGTEGDKITSMDFYCVSVGAGDGQILRLPGIDADCRIFVWERTDSLIMR